MGIEYGAGPSPGPPTGGNEYCDCGIICPDGGGYVIGRPIGSSERRYEYGFRSGVSNGKGRAAVKGGGGGRG